MVFGGGRFSGKEQALDVFLSSRTSWEITRGFSSHFCNIFENRPPCFFWGVSLGETLSAVTDPWIPSAEERSTERAARLLQRRLAARQRRNLSRQDRPWGLHGRRPKREGAPDSGRISLFFLDLLVFIVGLFSDVVSEFLVGFLCALIAGCIGHSWAVRFWFQSLVKLQVQFYYVFWLV